MFEWVQRLAPADKLLRAGPVVVLAVVSLVFGSLWLVERARHAQTRATLAEVEARWSAEVAAREAKLRAFERRFQEQVDEARRMDAKRQELIAQQAAVIAEQQSRLGRLDVDVGRMRKQLADYAVAAGTGQDSVSACQSRAERLAELLAAGEELLAESVELVREGAALARTAATAAQQRASELDACVSAYTVR